jgi:hypothetical protein
MNSKNDYVRSGRRVNSRVSVVLQWIEAGKSLRVEGQTIDVSPYGCFLVASQGIVIGQMIRVINQANGRACSGRVVRHGEQTSAGFEMGIRFEGPIEDLWELDF